MWGKSKRSPRENQLATCSTNTGPVGSVARVSAPGNGWSRVRSRAATYQSLIKVLQALHDTRHCAYFCCCTCFGIKIINETTRFDQIHQLFHKILSINIILKSIKGHNSVEKFGKIMCIGHNMLHIHVYQCINKILPKSIHYF